MKYRRLQKDELEELEPNFIRFLAAHSIGGDDWLRLKTENPAEVEQLISKFSDVVFEKTLKNLNYLQHNSPKDIKIFHCQADKMVMMGLKVEGASSIDFTQNNDKDAMMQAIRNSGAELQVYRAEKTYNGDREMELFQMMEQGCRISDGSLFEVIRDLVGA
ncbi:MAG: DUF6495 family protein [Bacteroidota bacterium]